MSRVSIRQPLLLYATVFMFAVAAVLVTIASFSLGSAARRTYRRALQDELRALAAHGRVERVERELAQRRPREEVDFAVVTSTTPGLGISLEEARQASIQPARALEAARIQSAPEAYVVARFDPSIPAAIGVVEISRMIPFALISVLSAAALMAFMIGRLVLPSLSSLAEIARDPSLREEGLVTEDAPNEILEVAQAFRRTVRQLHAERERLVEKHKELERMHLSMVRASKLASLGRLAAGIAHEIGNPLAAVQGYLSLFPRLDPAEQRDVVERSGRELARIHATIKKLLAYARQDAPAEPPAPVEVARAVDDAALLVRGHPAFRAVELELPPPGPAIRVLARPGPLGQVLVNLLLNAAQALVGQATGRVALAWRLAGDRVEIQVQDNGPGIPADRLEQIFDPFYTTKEPGEGTGLGLAVSRSLSESMGGELLVSSTPGEGATFTLRLPAA